MAAETWYTPAEAVAAGLADRVAEAQPSAAQAAWDLGVYDNAPAPAPEPVAAQLAPEPEPVQAQADPQIQIQHRTRRLAARLLSTPA
jgi:hypothetical protein